MSHEGRCPACGGVTQPGQRFCPSCGHQLSTEGGTPAGPPSSPPGGPPQWPSPQPSGGPPNRPRRRAARAALIVVPLLLLAGAAAAVVLVTGSSDGGSKKARTVDTQARERRAAQAKYAKCKSTMQPFLGKLHELDSRLDVGLSYDEYTNKVGDVRVAYDEVTPQLDSQPECVTSVGIPAEAAFNQYVKASNKWGNCFDDINCDTDSIEPTLRKYWDRASSSIDDADSGLQDIKQPGSGF